MFSFLSLLFGMLLSVLYSCFPMCGLAFHRSRVSFFVPCCSLAFRFMFLWLSFVLCSSRWFALCFIPADEGFHRRALAVSQSPTTPALTGRAMPPASVRLGLCAILHTTLLRSFVAAYCEECRELDSTDGPVLSSEACFACENRHLFARDINIAALHRYMTGIVYVYRLLRVLRLGWSPQRMSIT